MHANLARALLEASDRNFAAGDCIQGSEDLWGAATHAVMAVSMWSRWKWEMEEVLREAVTRLADKTGDPSLEVGFEAAVKFHDNFYDGEMEDSEIEAERPRVHRFVNVVLPLMKERVSRTR